MKAIFVLISALAVLSFTWDLCSANTNKDDAYKFENEDNKDTNPFTLMGQELYILEGIKCRNGYYNMSDDLTDAIYHCAQINHVKNTRKKFTEEKVRLADVATPLLCMRACVITQAGLVNTNFLGLNETEVLKVFSSEMTKPGGELSSFKLTKELMECDRKHPTKFPRTYHNCTDTQEFFRCTRRVMFDCNDNDNRWEKEFQEYIAAKRKLERIEDDEDHRY